MTFTSTPPTKPGFYAWKLHVSHRERAREVLNIGGGTLICNDTGRDIKDIGGLWCHLLPAEEVEKAFKEGSECGFNSSTVNDFEKFWLQSNARKDNSEQAALFESRLREQIQSLQSERDELLASKEKVLATAASFEHWGKERSELQSERDKLQQENQNLTDKDVQFCGEITELKEERDKLRKAMGTEQPWPITDILKMLCEATRHLLDNHDCDHHGHEGYRNACNLGLQAINKIKEALNHSKSTTQ